MNPKDIMNRIELILEDTGPAVLALSTKSGYPHMRWMVPTILKGREGALYAVSTPAFGEKLKKEYTGKVEWMLQKKTLQEVMRIKGHMTVIDNPSLRSEVMANIGDRLRTFWKVNPDSMDFIVLETVFENVTHFDPVTGETQAVKYIENKKS
jgi:general stress protein 26